VQGMTCGACSSAVERGLLQLAGVSHAAVSLTQNEAEVTFDPAALSPQALVDAVNDMGFEGALLSTAGQEGAVLGVSGMTCGACSAAVERALRALPGVTGADVNAVTGRAQVRVGGWVGGWVGVAGCCVSLGQRATSVRMRGCAGARSCLAVSS
jgi:Cu+-exporting ATPase